MTWLGLGLGLGLGPGLGLGLGLELGLGLRLGLGLEGGGADQGGEGAPLARRQPPVEHEHGEGRRGEDLHLRDDREGRGVDVA